MLGGYKLDDIQNWAICINIVVTSVTLIITILTYIVRKPKLKIEITDKEWDCFFGIVVLEKTGRPYSVCGANINIVNNSPVAITVNTIEIIVNKEKLKLINKNNKYWENCEFVFFDENQKLAPSLDICYAQHGLEVPFKIQAYDTVTAVVLFHNFPVRIKKKCRAKISLGTAIGRISKNVKMVECDGNYLESSYRDYLQYCRSIEVTEE